MKKYLSWLRESLESLPLHLGIKLKLRRWIQVLVFSLG